VNKTPVTIAAVLVCAGLAYTGASAWAGKQAAVTLEKQHKLLADLPYFVVKSRKYDTGIFTSHERTTIALNQTLTRPYIDMLKLAGEDVPNLEVTYTQTIHHGPMPGLFHGDFSLLKADVTTDIEFSAETQKWLTKVFGDQKPLQIENRVRFNDDGVFTIKIPSFNYEPLPNVKSVWQGLDSSITYGGDFNRVDILASVPGLHIEAGPKGVVFDVKQLAFEAHNQRGVAGLMLGQGKLTLEQAQFHQKEGDKPIDVKLDNISYLVKSDANGDFINSTGDIGLKTLTLNGKAYGPAKLSVAATHLHAPTLAALSKAVTKIQREESAQGNAGDQAAKMLDVFRKQGTPLLRNDPALAIKELSVKLPEGEVLLHADLALKGFQDSDLDTPIKLLERLQAHADLKVPKQVIETYVLWQARGMIATDTAEGQHPDTDELDNLARNLMEAQVRKLTDHNLIRADGDNLSTSAQWMDGKLSVNGQAVPLPWQAGGQPPAMPDLPAAAPATLKQK